MFQVVPLLLERSLFYLLYVTWLERMRNWVWAKSEQSPEIAYGSFSIAKADDGYIYLFGKSSDGIKVARVLVDDLEDLSSVRINNEATNRLIERSDTRI